MVKAILYALFFLSLGMNAQNEGLPYREVPNSPGTYTVGSVAARMIEGLGFRYYWATEGLRIEDLNFKPNEEARTTMETVDHILVLSSVILSSVQKVTFEYKNLEALSFDEKRIETLTNLKTTADILHNQKDLSDFILDLGKEKYPFWNIINGPIADALWHCGQITSFRRSSGNPINNNVSFLKGKVIEN